MADLYRDLVYTRNTSAIGTTDTTLSVEDVSLFPSNAVLARGEFWLTIESSLTYPHTFEIVRLTNVNSSTKVLTVVRGQAGTAAIGHSIATYIKGTLTTEMLRRVRSGLAGTTPPAPDADVYFPGDRFYHTGESRYYAFTGNSVSALDTFTRADNATTMGTTEQSPALTWFSPGTGVFGITSGRAVFKSGAIGNKAFSFVNLGGTDVDFTTVINAGTSGSISGIAFRMNVDGTYGYSIQGSSGGAFALYRVVNDSYTSLSSFGSFTANTAYTVRVRAVGSNLLVYVNGTQLVNFTETAAPAFIGGNVGFSVHNAAATTDANVHWDRFQATAVAATNGWAPTADSPGGLPPIIRTVSALAQAQDDVIEALRLTDRSLQNSVNAQAAVAQQVDDILGTLVTPYNVRVAHADTVAQNRDWILADNTPGTAKVAATLGNSASNLSSSTTTITTSSNTGYVFSFQGIYGTAAGSGTYDGTVMTQLAAFANTNGNMWAYVAPSGAVGNHTIALTPNTNQYGIVNVFAVEIVGGSSNLTTYTSTLSSNTYAVPGAGYLMLFIQANSSSIPSVSSGGGLTFSTVKSGSSGSVNSFALVAAPVAAAGSYTVSLNSSSHMGVIGVYIPGGGVLGTGTYTQIGLGAASVGGEILVSNTDAAKRIAVTGAGLTEALMPSRTGRYLSDGSSWRSTTPSDNQITNVTSNYVAGIFDDSIIANGTLTITLPAASSVRGNLYLIKNAGTGTVTINAASGTIDGGASTTLTTQYSVVRLVSDGTAWWIV